MAAKSSLKARRPVVPELGSRKLVDFGEIVDGWVAGIKYCAPEVVRSWQFKLRASTLAEKERVAELRKGKTAESHPHLFASHETVEGAQEMVDLALEVAKEALEPEDFAIVERLEPGRMLGVMLEVLQVQRPFSGGPAPSEGDGDSGS